MFGLFKEVVEKSVVAGEIQRPKEVREQILALEKERDKLNDDLRAARDQLQETRQKAKLEEQQLKHLTTMALEKRELEFAHKQVKLEGEKERAINAVKNEYRDKQEATLQKQIERGDTMYAQILSALPNVNVKMKGDM